METARIASSQAARLTPTILRRLTRPNHRVTTRMRTTTQAMCPHPRHPALTPVLRRTGRWAQVEGCESPLVNFTSDDMFALQERPEVLMAEQQVLSLNEITGFPCAPIVNMLVNGIEEARNKITSYLRDVHSTQEVRFSSANTAVLLENIVAALALRGCTFWALEDGSGQRYPGAVRVVARMSELRKSLKQSPTSSKFSGLSVLLHHLDITNNSLDRLRDLQDLQQEAGAKVFLLDPQGICGIRQGIKDIQVNIDTLRSPDLTLTSTAPLGDHSCVNYVTGTTQFTAMFDHMVCGSTPISVQHFAQLQKTKTMLRFLKDHYQFLYQALLIRQQIIAGLEENGVKMDIRQPDIKVHIPNERGGRPYRLSLASNLNQEMLRCGVVVGILQDRDGARMRIRCTGYHTQPDVTLLCDSITSVLGKAGYIPSRVNMAASPSSDAALQPSGQLKYEQ